MTSSVISRIQSLWSSLNVDSCHLQESVLSFSRAVLIYTVSLLVIIITNVVEWYEDVLSHKSATKSALIQAISPDSMFGKLKPSRLAQLILRTLYHIPVYFRSALVLCFCSTAQILLGRKYQASEVPETFVKNASYVCGIVLVIVLVSILIGANWESYYQNKDDLAIQGNQRINDSTFEIDDESLFRAGVAVDDKPFKTDSLQSASIGNHVEFQAVDSQENDLVGIESLLSLIKNISALDSNAIEQLAKTEIELLNVLDQSPHLIRPLLDRYVQLSDGDTKDLLRSLLATTGSLEIEQHAVEQVTSGVLANRTDWLALLRETGIQTLDSRNALLGQLTNFNQAEDLSSALLSFAPQIVSTAERQDIINQLSPYLDHTDDAVRNAAVVSLSRWAGSDHAYILEQALTDSSEKVRQAAVFAAFTSTIQSDYIKSILLGIMRDDNEPWPLRMDAHNALTGYSLQGQEHDDFFQFHQDQTRYININEVRG